MIIAHIDMDSFYVSCETNKNPSLKNYPIIVGGLDKRGVVSTACYKARKYGIKSAMPISIAKQKCPDAIFLNPNFTLYQTESDNVMQILSEFTDKIEQVSIDEAYLDLTEFSKQFKNLNAMGEFITQKIYTKTGLTCSIGISKSKNVAKIASDFNKPAGVTVVENIKEFLAPLAIEKIPGIGKVSKKIYNDKGIYKISDLQNLNQFQVMDYFGKSAIYFYQVVNGKRFDKINELQEIKSISKEETFQNDVSDKQLLKNTILDLCKELYARLENKMFRTISIKIRYHDFKTISRNLSIKLKINSIDELKKIALRLFEKNYNINEKIRLIGVKISNLEKEKSVQSKLLMYI